MGDVATLIDRIDAEFSGLKDRIARAQAERLQEHRERQDRLRDFERRLESLSDVWRPRLEVLIHRFRSHATATPTLTAASRQVTVEFHSELARIRLRLSATTDHDVRNLILNYDLEIIPVLMQFDSHEQAQWPLDAIEDDEIGDWVDDRVIEFVQTYLSLHENEHYLKEHMVEDPVANVRFPRFAAAASLDWQGKTYYFMGDETRSQFEASHGLDAHTAESLPPRAD
jgi:YHS domain-containing protein